MKKTVDLPTLAIFSTIFFIVWATGLGASLLVSLGLPELIVYPVYLATCVILGFRASRVCAWVYKDWLESNAKKKGQKEE